MGDKKIDPIYVRTFYGHLEDVFWSLVNKSCFQTNRGYAMTMMMFIPNIHKSTKWWAIKLELGKNSGC
jgi:hypothetical protein